MKLNVAAKSTAFTHEGGKSSVIKPLEELRRAVMTCLLWENTFYEGGDSIAQRISDLVKQVPLPEVAALAVQARNDMQLRHVPLFLVSEMSKQVGSGSIVAGTLERVIQRADELTEFLAIYWKTGSRVGREGKHPLSAGIKRGLARAFTKFTAYDLAKYNRDGAVKLRDVMFLVHPKAEQTSAAEYAPAIDTAKYKRGVTWRSIGGQGTVWNKLAAKALESPDTWEVELSAGKDKKETFERLMREKKLGGLAVLRNLRNMQQSGVDTSLIRERLSHGLKRVLPFRFVTAARYAPMLEDALEAAMFKGVEELPKLPGTTALLVDVSGSMDAALSSKGETTRLDAANGLAIYLREKSERFGCASFSNKVVHVPPRRGFALRDAVQTSQQHGGTNLKAALLELSSNPEWRSADRVMIITDEQSHDGCMPAWCKQSYIINVAGYQHGVGYDNGWTHISGWSERVIDYIQALENEK